MLDTFCGLKKAGLARPLTFGRLAANLVAHDIKARPEEEVEQRAFPVLSTTRRSCQRAGRPHARRRDGGWRTLSGALRPKHGDEVVVEADARELPCRQRVGQVRSVRMNTAWIKSEDMGTHVRLDGRTYASSRFSLIMCNMGRSRSCMHTPIKPKRTSQRPTGFYVHSLFSRFSR